MINWLLKSKIQRFYGYNEDKRHRQHRESRKTKNKFMYVSREDSRELEEGEFFIADMIGMEVLTVDGKYVGILEDVLQYSANDVYVVKGEEDKEFMIPAIKKFVPTIDIDERK